MNNEDLKELKEGIYPYEDSPNFFLQLHINGEWYLLLRKSVATPFKIFPVCSCVAVGPPCAPVTPPTLPTKAAELL